MRLNFSQYIKSALRALLANKLRSALTMLGIVIGVGSVVALLSGHSPRSRIRFPTLARM
jgi:hypothetical protein